MPSLSTDIEGPPVSLELFNGPLHEIIDQMRDQPELGRKDTSLYEPAELGIR
jgi:hypothetical protein